MLRSLLDRLRSAEDDAEPQEVALDDLVAERLDDARPRPGRPVTLGERLVATPCAAPRAFYDAPDRAHRRRRERLADANQVAMVTNLEAPPYYALREDRTKDLLFLARRAQWRFPRERGHEQGFRVEVELREDGGVLRDLARHEAPAPPIPLPPERLLELAQVLRQGKFWDLPTTEDETGRKGFTWYVSRLERGRQHLIVRHRPSGATLELLESLAAVLDDELALVAQHHATLAAGRCAFAPCDRRPEASGVCAEHRRRIDAQGENLARRR